MGISNIEFCISARPIFHISHFLTLLAWHRICGAFKPNRFDFDKRHIHFMALFCHHWLAPLRHSYKSFWFCTASNFEIWNDFYQKSEVILGCYEIKRGNRTTHFGPVFSDLNIFLVLDFLTQNFLIHTGPEQSSTVESSDITWRH